MTGPNDITEISSITNDNTMVNSPPETDGAALSTPNPTQYTQYHSAGMSASGFAEAQAIAQRARSGNSSGSLLKKRFLLEDVLGQGGMGTVYRTRDLRKVEAEDPNPYIATKVLNSDFRQHPNAFVTLQQETAKSHALAHPNIVTVHDFDRDGDTIFMTMELLDGEPLDKLLRRHVNGISRSHALPMIRDMCAALSYAHQRHIIHADFKPGNVFVCRDGTTKVLDFGIARAASKESQRHRFDAAELGALTPAYATVEMLRDEPLTFADDVYALACVAYEILTGQHPYQGHSALEARQLGLKPKPVTHLSHGEWRALHHALALEKSQRTASVSAFAMEMFPRRNGMALAAAGLAVVALSGAAWFGYSQHQAKIKIQNTINENLAAAQTCFAQSDFSCALEHALVASNLDVANTMTAQLVSASQLALQKQEREQKVTGLLDDGDKCLAGQDPACAQVKAKEVLALDPTNVRATAMLTAATALDLSQDVSDNIQQADTCLQNKDLACAELFAKKAAELNANDGGVKALLGRIEQSQLQSRQVAQLQQQKINSLLQLAQDCYGQKKYDCAIQQANAVLVLDAANAKAVEIKQSATVIQQQGRDAESKIANILMQARDCLDRQKNYSCAIAKAEAALDLVPNNAEAMAIKSRAQETQRRN